MYGIGTDWKIYEMTVDKTANSVTPSAKLGLSGYVSGWGTHNNEYINGLEIDPATGNIFFNYSYNNHTSASAGTMTDLSLIVNTPLPVPESSTSIAIPPLTVGGALEWSRRRRAALEPGHFGERARCWLGYTRPGLARGAAATAGSTSLR